MNDKAKGKARFDFWVWPWMGLVALTVLLQAPSAVWAQQGNPEVYVDMSVLQGLGGQAAQELKPVVLRPPSPTTKAPPQSATAVHVSPTLPVAAPLKISAPPAMPSDHIRPATAAAIPTVPASDEIEQAAPVAQQVKHAADPSAAVAFPVKTKIRQETSDPAISANTSRPVPLRSGIAGNLKDAVTSRPAPDFDPASSPTPAQPVRDLTEMPEEAEKNVVTAQKLPARSPVIPGRKPERPSAVNPRTNAEPDEVIEDVHAAAVKAPPVPPRRPDVERVSPEIIAALIERENKKMAAEKYAAEGTDPPPPPGPRGKKNMPAVAKPSVQAEPLGEQIVKLPMPADPLLGTLVEKDKEDLVATIESLVAAREDGTPLPKTAPVREQGSNIISAEPMQRPYNVFRPKHEEGNAAPQPSGAEPVLQAIVEDDGDPNRISLSFETGITDLDNGGASKIDARVVPLLNNNPSWKLQIQAFASPDKEGTGNARKASLARGMAVRAYLMDKGVEPSRLEVRALGTASEREPKDRVDLIVIDPTQKG